MSTAICVTTTFLISQQNKTFQGLLLLQPPLIWDLQLSVFPILIPKTSLMVGVLSLHLETITQTWEDILFSGIWVWW